MGLVIDDMPRLGVIRVSRWIFNCYLIYTRGGAIVVDPGLPHAAHDLAPLLDNVDGGLLAIVATHGHSDHVAGAAQLADRYRAPIYLPAVTLGYLDGLRPRVPRPISATRIWPAMIGQPLIASARWEHSQVGAAPGT
jgi:glyoxylase-like metal-dependent hydrolase (beta-lactamase superfamily II)